MEVKNTSFSLLVFQSNLSLCNEFHGSLQSTQVVKAEGSWMKMKSLDSEKKSTKYSKQSMNEDMHP